MMPQEKGSVRSLGKALELLELLNRSRVPMTLQALSQGLRLPQEHHPLAAGHPAELRLHPAGVGWPVLSGDKAVRVGLRRVRCVGDHPLRPSPFGAAGPTDPVYGPALLRGGQQHRGHRPAGQRHGDPGGLGDRRPYAPPRHVAGEAAAVPAAGCHGALSDEHLRHGSLYPSHHRGSGDADGGTGAYPPVGICHRKRRVQRSACGPCRLRCSTGRGRCATP